MYNKKILLSILIIYLSVNVFANEFSTKSLFGSKTSTEKKEYSTNTNIIDEIKNEVSMFSTSPLENKKSKNQIEKERLEQTIKELDKKEELLYSKTLFMKSDKKINIKEKTKYIDIFIPYQNISKIKFDKSIKKYETLENPKNVIKVDKETNEIVFSNTDYMLSQQILVIFEDNQELNLILKVGDNELDRHTKYLLYVNNASKLLLPEYQKKLKITSVYQYFNDVAVSMIFNRIMENKEYEKYLLNRKKVDMIIHDGEATIEDIDGTKLINYQALLSYVYDSPFIEDRLDGSKKKLLMLELDIYNHSRNESLVLSEEFIKNRFSNYVAFYVGDYKAQENHILPLSHKRILIVIEDEYVEGN